SYLNLLILYLITQLFVRFLSFLFLFALYLNHKLTNNHLILYDVLLNFVSLLLIDLNNFFVSFHFYYILLFIFLYFFFFLFFFLFFFYFLFFYLNHKLTINHLILYDVLLNFVSLLLIDLNNSIDSLQFYYSLLMIPLYYLSYQFAC